MTLPALFALGIGLHGNGPDIEREGWRAVGAAMRDLWVAAGVLDPQDADSRFSWRGYFERDCEAMAEAAAAIAEKDPPPLAHAAHLPTWEEAYRAQELQGKYRRWLEARRAFAATPGEWEAVDAVAEDLRWRTRVWGLVREARVNWGSSWNRSRRFALLDLRGELGLWAYAAMAIPDPLPGAAYVTPWGDVPQHRWD